MKKFFIFLLVILTFSYCVFGDESLVKDDVLDASTTAIVEETEDVSEQPVNNLSTEEEIPITETRKARIRLGLSIEPYYSQHFALGDVTNLSSHNLGAGIATEYTLPFFPRMGVSGRVEWEYVFDKLDRVSSWNNINFLIGLFSNVRINEFILFRPEIAYGGIYNLVILEGEYRSYLDQRIQIAPSFRFTFDKLKDYGVSFEIAPLYAFFTQKNSFAQYLGIRAGCNFEF